MLEIKTVYKNIYEGDSEEAKVKFPFLTKGSYLKVLSFMSTSIGIFPLEKSFYISTFSVNDNKFKVTIEETNSIEILNSIIKREVTKLNEEQILLATNFLKYSNCKNIIT